jgi:hypothetical protein
MKKLGLVQRRVRSIIALYVATPKGLSLLRLCQNKSNLPIGRFENYLVAYPIIEDNEKFLSAECGKPLVGGVKRADGTIKIDGIEYSILRWHSPIQDQIQIYASEKYTSNLSQAIAEASLECENVAREIERRNHMRLGRLKVIRRGEIEFNDPVAIWYKAYGGPNVKTKNGWIDASPPRTQRRGMKRGEIGFPVGPSASIQLGQAYIDFFAETPGLLGSLRETTDQVVRELEALKKGGVTRDQQMRILTDGQILLVGEMRHLVQAVEKVLLHKRGDGGEVSPNN